MFFQRSKPNQFHEIVILLRGHELAPGILLKILNRFLHLTPHLLRDYKLVYMRLYRYNCVVRYKIS